MKNNKKMLSYFTNGIIKENPVLRLVLGTCPTLAVTTSLMNGLGMGVGFTCTLAIMGIVREIFGTGAIAISESLVIPVTSAIGIEPILIFILPPGVFFIFGMLIALSNKLAVRKGKKPVNSLGCDGCPSKSVCELLEQDKQKKDEMEDMLGE